jgi:hypothetical protein
VYELRCEGRPTLLFTDNETNEERNGGKSVSPYTKDAFHRYLVHGETGAVNPAHVGTKAAAHYDLKVPAGKSVTVQLRLAKVGKKSAPAGSFSSDFSSVLDLRRKEADDFYRLVLPQHVSDDEKLVMRQAFAGMLWSKQFYHYDLEHWLSQRDVPDGQEDNVRNSGGFTC